MAARIQARRAADGAGSAGEEFEPRDARFLRRAGHGNVERRRACANAVPLLNFDIHELAAEPDDTARHAAFADQQIRADADHRHGQVFGYALQEGGKIVGIRRTEQNFRMATDAEPRERRERRIGNELAPHGRQPVEQRGSAGFRSHHFLLPGFLAADFFAAGFAFAGFFLPSALRFAARSFAQ